MVARTNINLGGIRSAGRKVGGAKFITGFLAQRAKKASDELTHQRLLEREKTQRDFQAEQSELTRVASADQARLTREAQVERDKVAQERWEKTHGLAKTKADLEEKRYDERVQTNELNLNLKRMKAGKTKIGVDDHKRFTQQYPLVSNIGLYVDAHNAEVGQLNDAETKAAAEYAMKTIIDGNAPKGFLTQEVITKYAAVLPSFFGNYNKVAQINTLIETQYSKKAARSLNAKVRPVSIGKTVGGEDMIITLPTAAENKVNISDTKLPAGVRSRAALDNLRALDTQVQNAYGQANGTINKDLLTKENKATLIQIYQRELSRISDGFLSQKSTLGGQRLLQPGREKIFSSAPFLEELIKEEALPETVLDSASFFRKNANPLGHLPPTEGDPLEDRVTKEDAKALNAKIMPSIPLRDNVKTVQHSGVIPGSVETYMLADLGKLNSVKELQNDPTTKEKIRRMSTNYLELERDGFTIGGKEEVVLSLLKDISNGGPITEKAGFILMNTIKRANPSIMLHSDGKGNFYKVNNEIVALVKDQALNKTINAATQEIQEGEEVVRLADDIQTYSASIDDAQGAPGDIRRKGSAIGELITVGVRAIGRSIKEVGKDVSMRIGGKFVNMEMIKSTSLAKVGKENAIKRAEREKILARIEGNANKELEHWREQHRLNRITDREKIIRERIVLKKIALTYRMSGLLQGDSSGRTISNADFDIAARALWGPAFGVSAKMDDIKEFFSYRIRSAKLNRDYAKYKHLKGTASAIGNVMNKAFNDRKRKEMLANPDEYAKTFIEEGERDTIEQARALFSYGNLGDWERKYTDEYVSKTVKTIKKDHPDLAKGLSEGRMLTDYIDNPDVKGLLRALKKHTPLLLEIYQKQAPDRYALGDDKTAIDHAKHAIFDVMLNRIQLGFK